MKLRDEHLRGLKGLFRRVPQDRRSFRSHRKEAADEPQLSRASLSAAEADGVGSGQVGDAHFVVQRLWENLPVQPRVTFRYKTLATGVAFACVCSPAPASNKVKKVA